MLRKLLEERRIALTPAHRDDLVRVLTAISWTPTGTGKIIIESKADIRVRSPRLSAPRFPASHWFPKR